MQIRNISHNAVGSFDCEIYDQNLGWIPFTASPLDNEQTGRDIFAAIERGEFGPVGQYSPPPSIPPTSTTKRKALLALFDLKGIRDTDVAAAIETISDSNERYRAQVNWDGATEVHRADPTLKIVAAHLGLTDADLDALFLKTNDYPG